MASAFLSLVPDKPRNSCAAGRQSQRSTRQVWSAHARASVCTLLLHAPGLVSCVRQHASCQSSSKAAMAARGGRIIFFIFLECYGMNSFFSVTQSFSPHRSLVNFLKIHFPMKQYSRSTRLFFLAFFTSKMISVPHLTVDGSVRTVQLLM